VITWPRVRIVFAIIGMISTAIFLWDQLEFGLAKFVELVEWLKGMIK
jgi:uncharacterized protein (DUF983 family)